MRLTLDQLRECMPNSPAELSRFLEPLNESMEIFDINNLARQSAFLANLAHESGEFRYMEEIASGAAYDGRADLGNTRPEAIEVAREHGSTPGRWFKGHGPLQITGYDNHKACGEFFDLDLLNEPRLLCEPHWGCMSAGWFWTVYKSYANMNELADSGKFERIVRVINGGINGLDDRRRHADRIMRVLQEYA